MISSRIARAYTSGFEYRSDSARASCACSCSSAVRGRYDARRRTLHVDGRIWLREQHQAPGEPAAAAQLQVHGDDGLVDRTTGPDTHDGTARRGLQFGVDVAGRDLGVTVEDFG